MKKKILVITVLLLTFAFISIPVMGKPATKIEGVTIEVHSTGPPVSYDGYPRFVSDGTISHARGESSPGSTVTLTIPIPGQEPLVLDGGWHTDWIANGNWKKGEWVISSKGTMTFEGGMFVSVNQRRITGDSPMSPTAYFKDRSVWKGTGIFKGWTLKLSREGTSDVITDGYLIMPK